MRHNDLQPDPNHAGRRWSIRLLIVSLAGIALLTLFPFRIDGPANYHSVPFLLSRSLKHISPLDFFLNVLLFLPYGFGLSVFLQWRGVKGYKALFAALIAGFVTSYAVEFIQFYIPTRDSGWNDTISNTTGAAAGYLLFVALGTQILRLLSNWEDRLESLVSVRRACGFLAVYFLLFFAFSGFLQTKTRLSNWNPGSTLMVGADASGHHPWSGRVFRLQIWDRALPRQAAEELTAGGEPQDTEAGLMASYSLSGTAPYSGDSKDVPALAWTTGGPPVSSPDGVELNGRSWLTTGIPAADLTRAIQKTSQFSVRVVCAPAPATRNAGSIVSLAQLGGENDLRLWQDGSRLGTYIRNPLSGARSRLSWSLPDIFENSQVRDILWAYDGSNAFLYVDGRKLPQVYRLNPGASLIHSIHFARLLKTGYLGGDNDLYQIMLFVPAGLLVGLAARNWPSASRLKNGLLALSVVAPPVILDLLLCWVSGRGISARDIVVSFLLTVGGILLVNADRHFAAKPLRPKFDSPRRP